MTVSRQDKCPSCGSDRRGLRFCPQCGRASEALVSPVRSEPKKRVVAAAQAPGPVAIAASQSLGVELIQVTIVCAIASIVCWVPFAAFSRAVNSAIFGGGQTGPNPLYQLCSALQPGSLPMFVCSAGVGLATLAAGPLIVVVVLFIFRNRLAVLLKGIFARLPSAWRHLGAPLTATLVFVVGWAGVHFETASDVGFLPQWLFPVVIGLFTCLFARYAPALQRRLRGFLRARDSIPWLLRLALAVFVPLSLGTVITSLMADNAGRITNQAFTEQLVVIVSLVAGFAFMVPGIGGQPNRGQPANTRGRA